MWTVILSVLAGAIPAVMKLFGFGGAKDKAVDNARELGRAEQQNVTMKGEMDVVRRANDAAKKVEREEAEHDPNDRSTR